MSTLCQKLEKERPTLTPNFSHRGKKPSKTNHPYSPHHPPPLPPLKDRFRFFPHYCPLFPEGFRPSASLTPLKISFPDHTSEKGPRWSPDFFCKKKYSRSENYFFFFGRPGFLRSSFILSCDLPFLVFGVTPGEMRFFFLALSFPPPSTVVSLIQNPRQRGAPSFPSSVFVFLFRWNPVFSYFFFGKAMTSLFPLPHQNLFFRRPNAAQPHPRGGGDPSSRPPSLIHLFALPTFYPSFLPLSTYPLSPLPPPSPPPALSQSFPLNLGGSDAAYCFLFNLLDPSFFRIQARFILALGLPPRLDRPFFQEGHAPFSFLNCALLSREGSPSFPPRNGVFFPRSPRPCALTLERLRVSV